MDSQMEPNTISGSLLCLKILRAVELSSLQPPVSYDLPYVDLSDNDLKQLQIKRFSFFISSFSVGCSQGD